jgi:histidinol-phosphate aminotransferase
MHDLIKLNTNENPYGPSPRVLAAIAHANDASLRRYPDPSSRRLRETIAQRTGLDAAEVFVGNGSDEVLGHTFQALLKHDAPLLFADVTYGFYTAYCRLYGIAYEQVPLDDAMQIRIEDYQRPCGAIILANPNAQTGCTLAVDTIEALLVAHRDQVVVVDEAYVDFGAHSVVPLIKRHDNLLVTQTLSKSRSLAGLRVGLALGQRPLIEALERVKDSFNSYPLDRLAEAGAVAAFEDQDWFEHTRTQVMASRERLRAALLGLGFEVLPSLANFLLARHPAHAGAQLSARLRERAILVRNFPGSPRIADFLRITVGTEAQCASLVQALTQWV